MPVELLDGHKPTPRRVWRTAPAEAEYLHWPTGRTPSRNRSWWSQTFPVSIQLRAEHCLCLDGGFQYLTRDCGAQCSTLQYRSNTSRLQTMNVDEDQRCGVYRQYIDSCTYVLVPGDILSPVNFQASQTRTVPRQEEQRSAVSLITESSHCRLQDPVHQSQV